jgi:DNA-binding SARP family transcriptional activator
MTSPRAELTLALEPAPPPTVRIALCGGLEIEVAGERVEGRVGGLPGLLIAYLALNHGRPVSRDELIERLWEGPAPTAPKATLSVKLSLARQALGEHVIDAEKNRPLGLHPSVEIDVETALQAADDARQALDDGRVPAAIELARRALATLERELLPAQDAAWVHERRRELEELRADALETLAEAALAAGGSRRADAERAVRTLVEQQPYRESGYVLLMRCHEAAGNVAEAIRTYERLREVLRDELGMVPGPAARGLAERLLQAPRQPPAGAVLPSALRKGERAPLCGREEELARLLAWWRGPGAGLRLCALSGDAGIGKTRLAAELARRAHTEGACVLYGRSDAETTPVPYQPLAEAVRQLLARRPELAEHARATEVARLVPELHGQVDEPAGDPQLRRYLLFEAVTTLLAEAAEDAGLLLVLDDLQWADQSTTAMLRHLLRAEVDGRIAVLALHRAPELSCDHPVSRALADAWRERPGERMALTGLDAAAVTRLVDAAMSSGATPELLTALRSHTGGNPLFLEEIVRELRERGAPHDGPASLDDLAGVGVPQGVQVVVGRRLERLGVHAVTTLTDAAALGLEFELRVLERLAGENADPLDSLERAVDAGIVVERARAGRFAFAHELVRHAVYARRSHARRARTHARIARLLADEPELGARPGELAYHWDAAGEPAPALDASLAAAAAAEEVGAFDDALRHYERALTLWPKARVPGTQLDTLEAAAAAARWSGAPKRAAELVREATRLLDGAPGPDPEARRAQLQERLGRYLWEYGDGDESLNAYQAAVQHLDGRDDIVESARALAGIAVAHLMRERYETSREHAAHALAIARALGARREEGRALNTHGSALVMTGRVDTGVAELSEALAIARESGSLEDECRAYCNLAEVFFRVGDTKKAAEIALDGYAFARSRGLERSGAPIVAANAIAALTHQGDWDEARRLADESLAVTIPDGAAAYLRVACARLSALRGEAARAAAELAKARRIVHKTYEPAVFAELEEAYTEHALLAGDVAGARHAVSRGLAALDDQHEQGELTLRVCALGLRVAMIAGDREWGAELAERARRLVRLMSADRVLRRPAAAHALACEAEWARLDGRPAAAAWGNAARALLAAGDLPATVQAELEQAAAWLSEGDARQARDALERAESTAAQLSALPPRQAVERLRRTAFAGHRPPGS